ncbi:Calcyphosin-like protein [Tritrichomonas foetus]|uniref:Calcyphosin-like protein n=1 Tax=Tritrichomonas foetus TaxID=1144522 RepID=A0A1J4JW99_9EUKA|nr:Calcyphosin-like protein [Tritrichomonas foetus]|eukprot:OHT01565.1 Calcyphosin-like protein [Tritrichomonas foetus]
MEDRFFITPDDLSKRIRNKIEKRGLVGLRGLGTLYRQSEENPNQEFNLDVEVPKLLSDFGVFINHTEVVELKRILGKMKFDHVNLIDLVDFITPRMNDARLGIIEKVYKLKDSENTGNLEIEKMRNISHFQTSAVTLLAAKQSSPEALFQNLIRLYEKEGASAIPRDDFFDYYRLVSANIESDHEFITMVKASWGI